MTCENIHKCPDDATTVGGWCAPSLLLGYSSLHVADMQPRLRLALATFASAWACVPGGPIYFGPPVGTIRGAVFSLEDNQAVPNSEICVLGSDTTCVRANGEGKYDVKWATKEKVDVRFRIPGVRPALVEDVEVVLGEVVVVDCVLSTRVSLSTAPGACHGSRNQ